MAKNDKLIFEGTVKTSASHTYIIADNTGETFNAWIHKHVDKLEGKNVKIMVEEIQSEEKTEC